MKHEQWADWDEPYRTTYGEYVVNQSAKDDILAITSFCKARPSRPTARASTRACRSPRRSASDTYENSQSASRRLPSSKTYGEYVVNQSAKDDAVEAVRGAVGQIEDFKRLDPGWVNGPKLHAATLPLAEFAAVVGNLRAARFGRDSAWRTMATFGALDELRHTQIPLALMHELVRWDAQFDWTQVLSHEQLDRDRGTAW